MVEGYNWGIIGVVLGVILGFTLNLIKDWIQNRAKKNTEIFYLSVLVINKLDRFSSDSLEVIADNGSLSSNGEYSPVIKWPDFEPLSIDVNWRVLPEKLILDIFSFPSKINYANYLISGAFGNYSCPPDHDLGFEEMHYQYAILALEAMELANRLRKLSKLAMPEYKQHEFNPTLSLTELIKNIETKRRTGKQTESPFLK